MTQPAGHEIGYSWPGLPVTCMVCLQGGVPTYKVTEKRCGFVMPEHDMQLSAQSAGADMLCPGSGAPVQKPVHATMARRIEEHVVAAMPPGHLHPENTPEASRLSDEIDIWKGPGS